MNRQRVSHNMAKWGLIAYGVLAVLAVAAVIAIATIAAVSA